MNSIRPVLDLMQLAVWKFCTWGLHPLSPFTPRAVIRMNELEQRGK